LTLLWAIGAGAATWDINVTNFQFTPSTRTIQQGDTVRWTNTQGTHNVHHTGNPTLFHSGTPVGPGAAWPYVFVFSADVAPVGTYNFVCQAHAGMAGSITVQPLAADERTGPQPATVQLEQNYPNPFNASTSITFHLPAETAVKATVLNVLGQTVATLADGRFNAGTHHLSFSSASLSTGIYFYTLQTAQSFQIRKMLVLK
jgi:plastocyanin